jgi:hypothetical protein
MTPADLVALVGASVIGLGFFAARWREEIFIACGVATVSASLALVWHWRVRASEALLGCGGLFLLFFGLGIARVMLHRSASLRMLARFAAGGQETSAAEDIARRLRDLEKFRLAASNAGRYRLTLWGRFVGACVAPLYGATRLGE